MAFNKHLRLSWKLETPGLEKMVTVDHSDPLTLFAMETWLKTEVFAKELSEGILVLPNEEAFVASNQKAIQIGLIGA